MAVGLVDRVERLTNLLNNLNQDRRAPRPSPLRPL